MFKRKHIAILVFVLFFCAMPWVSGAWQGTSQIESQGTQVQRNSLSNPRKKNKKRVNTDFWSNTQNMRYKLFKEDLADTSRYSNPIITEVPTLKSESIPCSLRPSSGAGFKTNCKF